MTPLILIIVIPIVLIAALFGGLRVKPRPFPPLPAATTKPEPQPVTLTDNLPAPVARYYSALADGPLPQVHSAVLTGSASLRIAGVTFPSRFRFVHQAGQGYRHYMEATVFGFPVFKVNEWFVDGHARLELPVGVVENDTNTDYSANLALWAEAMWFPAIWLTDARVRWEDVNGHSARLCVPWQDGEQTLSATFDPETGLLHSLETMRYKDPAPAEKIRWTTTALGWETFDGVSLPVPAAVTWGDEDSPWSTWVVEDAQFNVDVSDYLRASGI